MNRDDIDHAITWHDTSDTYQPATLPLSDFLQNTEAGRILELTVPEHQGLRVFIDRDCMNNMQAHAQKDISREQAGILCGHAYVDIDGAHYINVTAAIAVNTLADSVHFRFQKDSWQQVWEELEGSYNILGWYHTHPGMGVFLSPADLRTQELYFAAPWQIALVLDPVRLEIGVFCGREGKDLMTGSWKGMKGS
jgi:proteasome lid subunit RPN8/RPN11